MSKEKKFYDTLQNVFIGAKLEGEGGFINLMKMKSSYYRGIETVLKKDIESVLKKYPNFKDELYDKLYTFFSRYFTKSGSIYFNSTPFHNNIYEQVYTDDRDVILFWKTQMLYYVKTDRIFQPAMEVIVDELKFKFDASKVENKKANEKRNLIYELGEVKRDKTISIVVKYSERGTTTKTEDILKEIRKKDIKITEEQLEKVFSVFQRQSEVDFFINKDAKKFLQEQFKLWSYQYFWDGAKEWTAERVNEIAALKDIAYKIIDFVSQFEDELVKIWNKPKFVKNSNYVITFDRILSACEPPSIPPLKKGGRSEATGGFETGIDLIKKIFGHKGIKEQFKEWESLRITPLPPFFKGGIIKRTDLFDSTLHGEKLKKEFEHLPIDTKYFKDLELEILSLFDNLDDALDGRLIKSENYQALNTIMNKYKGEVQTIYVDPPFNTGNDFDYTDRFQDSSWLSIMNDRLTLAKDFLDKKGNIFLHLDFNADYYGRILLNNIFGNENFSNEIKWYYTNKIPDTRKKSFTNSFDVILAYAKDYDDKIFTWLFDKRVKPIKVSKMKKVDGKKIYLKGEDGKGIYDLRMERTMDNIWQIPLLHAQPEIIDFKTQKPEELMRRVVSCSQDKRVRILVMDFFVGSGTTTSVSQKLGNFWIGVEMGSQFQDKLIPRMKEVLAGFGKHEPCGISELTNWQGGGFFKYYELEQYEEALSKCKYSDGDLFSVEGRSDYEQYVFMKDEKLLDAIELDYKKNKVNVKLDKIYDNIDIAETLSNLSGKWIKRIEKDKVIFEDDSEVNTKELDYRLIKPLIWWE